MVLVHLWWYAWSVFLDVLPDSMNRSGSISYSICHQRLSASANQNRFWPRYICPLTINSIFWIDMRRWQQALKIPHWNTDLVWFWIQIFFQWGQTSRHLLYLACPSCFSGVLFCDDLRLNDLKYVAVQESVWLGQILSHIHVNASSTKKRQYWSQANKCIDICQLLWSSWIIITRTFLAWGSVMRLLPLELLLLLGLLQGGVCLR